MSLWHAASLSTELYLFDSVSLLCRMPQKLHELLQKTAIVLNIASYYTTPPHVPFENNIDIETNRTENGVVT